MEAISNFSILVQKFRESKAAVVGGAKKVKRLMVLFSEIGNTYEEKQV